MSHIQGSGGNLRTLVPIMTWTDGSQPCVKISIEGGCLN